MSIQWVFSGKVIRFRKNRKFWKVLGIDYRFGGNEKDRGNDGKGKKERVRWIGKEGKGKREGERGKGKEGKG